MITSSDPGGPGSAADKLRASDADREQVAAVVRQAFSEGRISMTEVDERLAEVYSARTIGDLRLVTRDLPGHSDILAPVAPGHGAISRAAAVPVAPVGGVASSRVAPGPESGQLVAVFSGTERRGRWHVPKMLRLTTIFGGADLDLTEAVLADREVTIRNLCIFGGAQVTVPDDVCVISDVVALFGGAENRSVTAAHEAAAVIHLRGFVMFGGISVTRPKEKRRKLGR